MKPIKHEDVVKLLKNATATQLIRVRDYLRSLEAKWGTGNTPNEYDKVQRANEAFMAKRFADRILAQYLTREVIADIFDDLT